MEKIIYPKGFFTAGIHCGIKEKGKDLGVIYSTKLTNASGLFTTNKIKSASVLFTQSKIKKGKIQAVIINSGNANTCTGRKGLKDVEEITSTLAKELKVNKEHIAIASTGVIGKFLPVKRIKNGIKKISKNLNKNMDDFVHAIMTTDTTKKCVSVKIKIDGKDVVITGFAKGSGMIYPHLATLLCFIITDCAISSKLLSKTLKEAIQESFNLISIDGDTSTNDMILILANELASNKMINTQDENYRKFSKSLKFICQKLSKLIVLDGEGMTKFIEIKIKNAQNIKEAKEIGFSIANSNLVKTALFGEDPNFGRIMMALGKTKVDFNPSNVDLYLGGKKVIRNGTIIPIKRSDLKQKLKNKKNLITIDLKQGKEKISVFTTDLSYDYVKINASYST